MRFVLPPILVLALSALSWADPVWLHPDLTEDECKSIHWRTRGLCYQEFYKQKALTYQDFILFELGLADQSDSSCKGVTEAYLKLEAAWEEYKSAECDLETHCTGPCGSGHSTHPNDCRAGLESQRYERRRKNVESGIETWGCRVRPNEGTRGFQTKTFDIVLDSMCPTGRIHCDKIRYTRTNRETGESIEAIGKELLIMTEYPYYRFKGYFFEHEGLTYKLLTSGRLTVEDKKSDEIVLDEQGRWARR